ncbi:MAG: NfeD family protein [Elusimicrobiota bacterium]
MKLKLIKRFIIIFLVFFFFGEIAQGKDKDPGPVHVLKLEGTVNPVSAQYLTEQLKSAGSGANSVIIKMDTPGGLMSSMRDIIKEIEASEYPVIVYVGPSGARAASAGVFITMSSDIAAMARGTNIGAAHPVKMGGQEISKEQSEKMSQDARAYIKALAEKHGRNAGWAQKAVTQSLSITSTEALEKEVIDYEVGGFGELKDRIEGVKVEKNDRVYTITFEGGTRNVDMSPFRKFLNYIADPNFAYILLVLGIYGLIYEFSNPGIELGIVVGGVALLLAALSFQMLPINTVGILLIIFGVVLMLLDIWVPSYGILTTGGLVSFLVGSLTLYDVKELPLDISPELIIGATVTTGLFFVFAVSSGIHIQGKKVTTGKEGMIGLTGDVEEDLNPDGKIYVRGEFWDARSVSGNIQKESKVKIVETKGNRLLVEKKDM